MPGQRELALEVGDRAARAVYHAGGFQERLQRAVLQGVLQQVGKARRDGGIHQVVREIVRAAKGDEKLAAVFQPEKRRRKSGSGIRLVTQDLVGLRELTELLERESRIAEREIPGLAVGPAVPGRGADFRAREEVFRVESHVGCIGEQRGLVDVLD